MRTLLSVQDLSYAYTNVHVLENLNLKMYSGELICLLGLNGIGKSTLLRTLVSLKPWRHASFSFLGKQIKEEEDAMNYLRLCSYLGDKFGIYRALSVYENLSFFNEFYKGEGRRENEKEKLKKIIEDFRLEPFRDQYAENLSQGNLKKLGLARLFLNTNARLLYLDEPMNSLDSYAKNLLLLKLKYFLREGKNSVLLATHNPLLYLSLAKRYIVLRNNGKSISEFTAEQFKNKEFQNEEEEIKELIPKN